VISLMFDLLSAEPGRGEGPDLPFHLLCNVLPDEHRRNARDEHAILVASR
jgi:hypothetical protein